MEMRQFIDNPFTALQSALKMRLSHHKQIKAAVFVGQTIYCIISNQSCIISSHTTVSAGVFYRYVAHTQEIGRSNFFSKMSMTRSFLWILIKWTFLSKVSQVVLSHSELRLNLAGMLTWLAQPSTTWDLQKWVQEQYRKTLSYLSAAWSRPFEHQGPPKYQNWPAKFKRSSECDTYISVQA